MSKKNNPVEAGQSKKTIDNSSTNNSIYQAALTIITSTNPQRLTKEYFLNENGELGSKNGGNMVEGKSEVKHIENLEGLSKILQSLSTNQALTYGITKKPLNKIVESRVLFEKPDLKAIARTLAHFKWFDMGGVLMIDYDPPRGEKSLSKDSLVKILREAEPALKKVKMLWYPSSSSHIFNAEKDKDLTGLRGQRLYILVDNASEIERIGETLFKKLWLKGHGHILISESGSLLTRSLIDGSVWQSNRLDFAAGASCKKPLEQRRGKPIIISGENEYLETKSIKPLSPPDEKRFNELVDNEKQKHRKKGDNVKKQHIKNRLTNCKEEDKPALKQALETAYFGGGVLTADFIIEVIEGNKRSPITVREILKNPEKYNELKTLDPIEPEYNNFHPTGKLYLLQDEPILHSFAHGEAAYRLTAAEKQTWFDEHTQAIGKRKFNLTRNGLFCEIQGKQHFICAPLQITASTVGENGNGWGRLLEWYDPMGKKHKWIMPNEMLSGDGNEIRKKLLAGGLTLNTYSTEKNLLNFYLASAKPKQVETLKHVKQLGWHGNCYIMTNKTFGEAEHGNKVVYYAPLDVSPAFESKGTLKDWQKNVIRYVKGNSRLLFAVSLAFAPVLLDLGSYEGCIFHFHGGSSNGKSTSQEVAASIWGNKKFKRSWRVTDNAAEGIAEVHNDNILILDELGLANPKELGNAVYMLVGGEGKARATKEGEARATKKWRIMGFSSGEIGLVEHLNKVNAKVQAGQKVRFVEVRANTDEGEGAGVFETTHGMGSGKDLSDHLKEATKKFYGVAGAEFVKHICENKAEVTKKLIAYERSFKNKLSLPPDTPIASQVGRVITNFAIVAFAGEEATRAGITGLEQGEIETAIIKIFHTWVSDFGLIDKEEAELIAGVKEYFRKNHESKFANAMIPLEETYKTAHQKVGFYKRHEVTKEILFYVLDLNDILKEIKSSFKKTEAGKLLVEHKLIKPDGSGCPTRSEFIKAIHGERSDKRQRVSVFYEKVLVNEEENSLF